MEASSNDFPYLVSVIIPNFNYSQYIREAIDSVLNQTYKNIELFVIDDGSTDHSWEIICDYGNRIKAVSIPNSGVSAARNVGLSLIQGEYVAFLDSDDFWHPSKLSRQLETMIKHGADIVFSMVEVCDSELEVESMLRGRVDSDYFEEYLRNPSTAAIPLACSNALIRSNIVVREIRFDTALHTSADIDFFRRLVKNRRVVPNNEALVKYRRHTSSMSQSGYFAYYKDNFLGQIKLIRESRRFGIRHKFYVFLGSVNLTMEFIKSYIKCTILRW
jgi:glycosyltransferase involved in cell wall biosynthesis